MNELILIFALARLAYLFTSEDGPFRICDRLRQKVEPYSLVLNCPYCLSLWLAFAIMAAYSYNETITVGLLTPFALSGAALVVIRFYG